MDELEARIEALERAVTDGDHDLSELATEGETRERLAGVEAELGDLADRVAELEAATQALRGYVGNVRAVNRDVEQRADAALAKAESLESDIAGDTSPPQSASDDRGTPTPDTAGGATSVAANGRRPESGTATEGGNRPGENGTAGASTASEPTAPGNGHRESTGHEHCAACGQPTGDGTPDDAAATGRDRRPSAAGTERAGTDDPLDGVFEADGGHENGDGGTFDRIREML